MAEYQASTLGMRDHDSSPTPITNEKLMKLTIDNAIAMWNACAGGKNGDTPFSATISILNGPSYIKPKPLDEASDANSRDIYDAKKSLQEWLEAFDHDPDRTTTVEQMKQEYEIIKARAKWEELNK